ncbi:MAG: pyridoxal 5'-phosphate synthase glutaminase subunit PdxT [Candidatus Thermoplasmatota archaeon]|nr:pyridoxal 5'-phosphate synthase glutaminase subunit PdxT [Candidatus Thermoplasmatota archaeon]
MKVGVVGYQGDVEEHIEILHRLREEYKREVEPVLVKSVKSLYDVSALIIPGGESTTIYRLIREYQIYQNIVKRAIHGMPIMGTCAGLILLSKNPNDETVRGMGLLDIDIKRNAYGRQINSFQDQIRINNIGNFNAIFIRAPVIERVGDSVEVMATHNGNPVMVRSGLILGMTFHPELTGSTVIHDLFLSFIEGEGYISSGTRNWVVEGLI